MREQERKTAQEWYEELHESRGMIIYDADGFDRQNWIYSWTQEPLTKMEYYNKISMCSLMYAPKG